MHMAAAVETKPGQPPKRPCVVVAGGREPPHWEAYPQHQFVHTIGALPCCTKGGCWRDRTVRLRDGDRRDRPENLCLDVVNGLPHCMDLISADEIIRRIEAYFQGGVIKYLSVRQYKAAELGIAATAENPFDKQPLNLSNAGMACERFIKTIPRYPDRYHGRGIVVCGGGVKYFTNAWVCINMLRHLECTLPVQLWFLEKKEMNRRMIALLAPLGVECVDASKVRKTFPVRMLKGWELKPYALLHSPYRQVLLLDADNVPVVNPEFLFATPQFRSTGAIFWPDFLRGKDRKAIAIWRSFGLRIPDELEFESGQIVCDKQRCWDSLCLTLWINENSDFFYRNLYGDKETFHLAFRKLKTPYSLVQTPIHPLDRTMCQHDFDGQRIFQHRNMAKWDLFFNKRINGFRFERECRDYIADLRRVWDGRLNANIKWNVPADSQQAKRTVKIEGVMITCRERNAVRRRTLDNLATTDWGNTPLHIHFDTAESGTPMERQAQSSFLALQRSLERSNDYILFLEDDLVFNRHIRHNLSNWPPLLSRSVTLAGLYNPKLRECGCDVRSNARVVDPNSVFGSQGFLLSRETIEHILRGWHEISGAQDIRISRLAARMKNPVYYHAPSLIQHVGVRSTWGGGFHQAWDFDPTWRA
jgi:hypothetical protein